MGADLIAIARVKAPNGLKGKIWITPFGESSFSYEYLLVGQAGPKHKLLSCEKRRHGYVAALEGITTIEQAEALKGETLYIRRSWLPEAEENEHYWSDLIGLKVIDLSGRALGEIVSIFRTGANDVYVVDREKEYLIPAIRDVVKEIAPERGIIVVDITPLGDLID